MAETSRVRKNSVGSGMEGKKADRDAAQQKTFTKWVNTQLKRSKYEPVDDILTCWKTGWKLAQLTVALYGVKMRKLKKVSKLKLKPHYMDNISVAMEMLEKDAEVKTNFLKGEHLWEGDKMMMLGMVWAIILDHAIKGIKFEEDGSSATAKQGLLLWVQKQTKGYRDVDPPGVKNFHTSWKDGMALCALIHKFDPSLVDYDSLDKKNAKENCEKAIKIAEEKLDIPAYVEAADLYDTPKPDEKVVMTYVAEFFHKFGSLGEKQAALRRVNQFIQFQRNIWKLQTDYNKRAQDLLQWADSKIKEYQECNLGETQPEANAKLEALKDYLKNIKPGKAVEKMDIESLYGEIQSTLRINNRAPFTPDEHLAPPDLHSKWQNLQQAEAKYGAACRDHAFAFIKKIEYKVTAEQMKEFEDSFNHFDGNSDGTLNPDEFKAALAALSIAFKEEDAFKKIFAKVSEGNASISKAQYLGYMRMVNEDKGTPEQLLSSFEALADGKPTISSDQLNLIGEEDREFLIKHMESAEAKDTYNYKDLVGKSFA